MNGNIKTAAFLDLRVRGRISIVKSQKWFDQRQYIITSARCKSKLDPHFHKIEIWKGNDSIDLFHFILRRRPIVLIYTDSELPSRNAKKKKQF